jgi:hypothetical protein
MPGKLEAKEAVITGRNRGELVTCFATESGQDSLG